MKQLTVVFLVNNDSVLLAMKKRGFGKGKWNGAGGKVELSETVSSAMIRECKEEIGVTPITYEKVAEIVYDEIHSSGGRETVAVYVYVATEWTGTPTESDEMAPQWFATTDIPYPDMWADDIYWLPKILAGEKLRCTFKLDDTDQVIEQSIDRLQP